MIEIAAGTAVELVITGLAGAVVYRAWHKASFLPQRKTVPPFHTGVFLDDLGNVTEVKAGRYWVKPGQVLLAIDARARSFLLPARDLLTSDVQSVHVGISGQYKVVDAAQFVRSSHDGYDAFNVLVLQTLATTFATLQAQEVSDGGVPALRERLIPECQMLGIEITRLEISCNYRVH